MDDRRAHFLTMLGDTCAAAGLADFEVEVVLSDGTHVEGTPSPQPADEPADDQALAVDDELDFDEDVIARQTGYTNHLLINGSAVNLDDVIEFLIRSP